MLPSPTKEDEKFIVDELNLNLEKKIHMSDVRSVWAGIRPLVKDPSKKDTGTASISREHVVEVSDSKLVTITGGKWTTYRRMAEDAINKLLDVHSKIFSPEE